jgi:hypothetical protein
MNARQNCETVNRELMDCINAIDLSRIRAKLMHTVHGKNWSAERADAGIQQYRRFLYMIASGDGRGTVPTKEIDEVWHTHILDTRAYREDCMTIFGRFVDHYPYFGMDLKPCESQEDLEDAFAVTAARYKALFGEPYHSGDASGCGGCGGCIPCRPSCKDKKDASGCMAGCD